MTDRTAPHDDDVGRMVLAIAPRLAHAMRHRLGRLEPSLTYRQYRVLLHVAEGARSLTALRTPATVSLSTLSEVVDSLARRGFVARLPNPQDRRGVELTLTTDGEQALAAAEAALDELSAHLLADVSVTNRGGLQRALKTVDTAVQALLAGDHDR